MARSASLLLAGAAVSLVASAGEPVVLPSDPAPAALAAAGDLSNATAVALSPDEESAVAAFPAGKDDEETRIVVVLAGAEPFDGFAKGRVVSLRLAGRTALGVAERFDRKGRRSASLVAVEGGGDRRPREIVLPPTARGLDLLVTEETLFVAAEDEIRTFDAASLRSGFLYSVPGPNLAVAAIPGGTRLLLGRPDGLLLVDLADPQGRDGLPPRERVDTAAPVVEIAASPDGAEALARLEDGSILEIEFDPLRANPTGRTGTAILWPGKPAGRTEHGGREVVAVSARPVVPEPPGTEIVSERDPPIPPELAGDSATPHGGREVVAAEDSNRTENQSFQQVAPEAARPEIPSDPDPPEPPGSPGDSVEPIHNLAATVAAVGRVVGPAAGEVLAVVLLGPDNLLREAARVAPRPDGTWVAEGLAPGSYRAVLDGGSGKVLVSSPPFVTFRVEGGKRVVVPDVEVRRSVR